MVETIPNLVRFKMSKKTILLMGVGFLAACQADEVEIKISSDDILKAIAGESIYIDFEAEVGEDYTTVDDEKRDVISQVANLLARYFPDADVETDIGSNEYTIDLDGEIMLSTTAPLNEAPWYVAVDEMDQMEGYLVSLQPTQSFDGFNGALENINFMLGPDEYQQVKYRISGDRGSIIFGGGYLDGRAVTAEKVPLDGQKFTLKFEEGVWKSAGGGFIYIPE